MIKTTKAQRHALVSARDKGGAWYGVRGRAGGAYARMIHRLIDLDWLDGRAPYKLTALGLTILNANGDPKGMPE